jgi:hypothetical protein
MRTIFISHASEDKKRLGPYLNHLLSRLPPEGKLWIDTPAKIDPSGKFSEHEQIISISPGGKWTEELEQALITSECVLVFWSDSAIVGPRKIFRGEVKIGSNHRKCVHVCLDSGTEVPDPYDSNQIADISGFPERSDGGEFDRYIDKVLWYLRGNRDPDPALVSKPENEEILEKLPYLANRDDIQLIINAVLDQEKTLHDVAGSAQFVPDVFIVPYESDQDAVEMFVWRLTNQDGPALYPVDENKCTPAWHACSDLSVSHVAKQEDGSAFTERFRHRVKDALNATAKLDVPLCFWSSIPVDLENISTVCEWVKYWNTAFHDHLAELKAEQGIQVGFPIIAIIFVCLPAGEAGRKLRLLRWKKRSEIEKCVDLLSSDNLPGVGTLARARVRCLEKLGTLTEGDGRSWAFRTDVRSRRELLPEKVVGLFNPDAKLTMRQFANKVINAEWWRLSAPAK